MKKVFVLIAVVLLSLGLAVGREEPAEVEHGENHNAGVFERNVRIGVEMVNEDGESQGHAFIVTAIPEYKMAATLKNGDETAMVTISGVVASLENDDILVMLEAEILFAGERGNAELGVETAIRIRSGHEQEVAKMGGRMLIVHAEYLD